VNIKILKKEERWWPRLTLQEKKPLFLAHDFDRWQDESDAEKELQAKVGGASGLGSNQDVFSSDLPGGLVSLHQLDESGIRRLTFSKDPVVILSNQTNISHVYCCFPTFCLSGRAEDKQNKC